MKQAKLKDRSRSNDKPVVDGGDMKTYSAVFPPDAPAEYAGRHDFYTRRDFNDFVQRAEAQGVVASMKLIHFGVSDPPGLPPLKDLE